MSASFHMAQEFMTHARSVSNSSQDLEVVEAMIEADGYDVQEELAGVEPLAKIIEGMVNRFKVVCHDTVLHIKTLHRESLNSNFSGLEIRMPLLNLTNIEDNVDKSIAKKLLIDTINIFGNDKDVGVFWIGYLSNLSVKFTTNRKLQQIAVNIFGSINQAKVLISEVVLSYLKDFRKTLERLEIFKSPETQPGNLNDSTSKYQFGYFNPYDAFSKDMPDGFDNAFPLVEEENSVTWQINAEVVLSQVQMLYTLSERSKVTENHTFVDLKSDFLSLFVKEAIVDVSHSSKGANISCNEFCLKYFDDCSKLDLDVLKTIDDADSNLFCAINSSLYHDRTDIQFLKQIKVNISQSIISKMSSAFKSATSLKSAVPKSGKVPTKAPLLLSLSSLCLIYDLELPHEETAILIDLQEIDLTSTDSLELKIHSGCISLQSKRKIFNYSFKIWIIRRKFFVFQVSMRNNSVKSFCLKKWNLFHISILALQRSLKMMIGLIYLVTESPYRPSQSNYSHSR